MKQVFKKTFKITACIAVVSTQMMGTSLAVETMAPIVVTAGRVAENPANISADITVINQAQIEASQATDVAEVLRSQMGLDVASNGGTGKTTSVFIRGGNSKHTLVLIDGVRVGSATLGLFDWGNLSTTDIERIEIVRGPQSSLYGADAMGGVIQIFTKKGRLGTQTTISAESGTYGTQTLGLSARGGDENGGTYGISAETFKTDGFSAASSGIEADPAKRTSLAGQMSFISGTLEAELVLRSVDGTTDLDGHQSISPYAPADALNYVQDHKQTTSSIKITDHVSKFYSSTIQFARSTDNVVSTDPVASWNNGDFKTTIDQLTWQNIYDSENSTLLVGYDYHKDSAQSSSAGLNKDITQKAAFVSISSGLQAMDWNVSVRKDINSASDNKTTYKAGIALHGSENFSVTANYGTGFKAPSINDLYFPDDGFGTAGNPNLVAETSKSWDVGLSYQTASVGLNWVYFKQTYDNLIDWQFDPVTFGYSPANLSKAISKGHEVSLDWRGGWGFLRANWTKIQALNDATGLWLVRRAQKTSNVTLGTDFGDLHIESQMWVVGQRFDDAGNTKPLDKYKTIDVRMAYAWNETWKLNGRIENLKDVKYEEAAGYSVAGRSTYAGVSATF